MKYSGKALDKICGVLQEIDEVWQIGGNETYIRLPYYPADTNDITLFETRKSVLEQLQLLKAVDKLHKGKTKRKNENYFYWSFSIGKNYLRVTSDFKKQWEQIKEGGSTELTCICGNIKLNLRDATLQYNNNEPIEISPGSQEIQFLELLLQKNSLVTYEEISREVESTSYAGEGVPRAVGYIRKRLRKILLEAGMTKKEFKNVLTVKSKFGYKLNCPQMSQ